MSCDIFCVYKIDCSAGSYIGITKKSRFKLRKSAHAASGRFGEKFDMVSIYESKDPTHVGVMEERFIEEHDTYNRGLNKTKDGKGVFKGSNNFSTMGFKFSDESRRKMSEKRKQLIKSGKVTTPSRTEEQKKYTSSRVSESLKGTVNYPLPFEVYEEIFEMLKNTRTILKESCPIRGENEHIPIFKTYHGAFLYFYAHKYDVNPGTIRDLLVGVYQNSKVLSSVELCDLKAAYSEKRDLPFRYFIAPKRYATYERAFSNEFCGKFKLTNVGLHNIITDKRGKYDQFRV